MHDPRHILITGASSGIGAALALAYAAPGMTFSLHGRDRTRLDHIAAQVRSRGAEAILYQGEVTDAATMASWIAAADIAKPVDLVIASAGISAGTADFVESADQAAHIFAVNLQGALNTIQPLLATMKQRRRGQIAILSSVAGFRGLPGAPAYCASKAALRVYGEALRGEAAPYNVQINVICPGFIKTPMTDVNRFHMPFLMSAERAAHIIRKGLARNTPRIAFPWRMYALVWLLSVLPQKISDGIVARMPKK